MSSSRFSLSCLLVLALTGVGAGHAAAQQTTTATYDDWVLQCQTEAGTPQQPQPPQKICDIVQVTQVRGGNGNTPFSRLAILHAAKGQPTIKLVVQLPVNVSLRTEVKIQASDADPGIIAPFDRCIPGGCFADFEIKDDVIKKFRAAGAKPGKVTFKAANGQDVNIPLSFKGFAQAFDALNKD
jgi:invasion protein IalB